MVGTLKQLSKETLSLLVGNQNVDQRVSISSDKLGGDELKGKLLVMIEPGIG